MCVCVYVCLCNDGPVRPDRTRPVLTSPLVPFRLRGRRVRGVRVGGRGGGAGERRGERADADAPHPAAVRRGGAPHDALEVRRRRDAEQGADALLHARHHAGAAVSLCACVCVCVRVQCIDT